MSDLARTTGGPDGPPVHLEHASWDDLQTMVHDRLVLDVERGLAAQRRGDLAETDRQLSHALDIVAEFQRSLPVDDFRGGYGLGALYDFLQRRLVLARVGRDTAITDECLGLVTDLCAGWREVVAGRQDRQSA
ncbi:MAG TPA: flagellar export chaperone FliS [Marmoricola sp.]